MHKTTGGAWVGAALLMMGVSASAFADDNNVSLEGIVTGTYQAASESQVNDQDVEGEGNGELYLFGTLDMGPGAWHLEVRGSTTPRDNGVSSFYGSNASVGETTDSGGGGRIAATQLFYELSAGPGQCRAGLLDPTAVLDGNSVANTEYEQFLTGAFVNNPTIGFPSFVLGGAYQGEATEHPGYKVFVGSDSGLQADNDPTYSNVFELGGDRDGYHKGAFTSAELDWHGYHAIERDLFKNGQITDETKQQAAELKAADAVKLSRSIQALQEPLSRIAEKVATAG